MRPLLAVVLLAGLTTAAPVPKAVKKKDDQESLVGRWKPSDGTKQWYEFKDDGTLKTWNEPNEAKAVPYNWSIDPTASPKRMTLYSPGTTRPEWEVVYELDGDDLRMTYCHAGRVPAGVGKKHGIFNGQTRDTSAK